MKNILILLFCLIHVWSAKGKLVDFTLEVDNLENGKSIHDVKYLTQSLRKDKAGNPVQIRVKTSIQQQQVTKVIPIAPKPSITVKVPNREPDFSLLNKPPPIPFFLPKSAANAPRQVSTDPMTEPPDIAIKKLENEATTLKEEVAALKWLAKRKEQEWNSIIELLKKKEETWLKVKRQAELASSDKGFQKLKATLPGSTLGSGTAPQVNFSSPAMPEPPPPVQIMRSSTTSSAVTTVTTNKVAANIVNLPSSGTNPQARKVLVPVSQPLTQQTIQALSAQGLLKSGGVTPDGKRIIVVKKAAGGGTPNIVIPGATSGGITKVVTTSNKPVVSVMTKKNPLCVECQVKTSKFECAGCSKTWYCSKECQEKNWPTHEKKCGIGNTVVKQEVVDD